MAQYKTGSVTVTNGSATVTGLGTLWSAEVSAGDIFTIVGSNAWYEVASVASNTSLTLTANYGGTSASGASYAITRDFTTNNGWPYPQKGDIETASLIKRALTDIDSGSLSTVDINGGTIDGTTIGGTTAAAGSFTELTLTGDVAFGDNNKAIFGTGSDLQIYHDGSNSYIKDAGVGNLIIQGQNLELQTASGEKFIRAVDNAEVSLYFNESAHPDPKLKTTTTGVDITGTATMDGLTVDNGAVDLNLSGNVFDVSFSDSGYLKISHESRGGDYRFQTAGATGESLVIRNGASQLLHRIWDNGDIAFYEDTGTTAKFFWDASAERLGIGTSSPNAKLNVSAAAPSTIPALGSPSSHLAVGNGLTYGTMIGTRSDGKGFIQQQRFDGSAVAYDLLIQPNGGNLGLGVTPSAWGGSGVKAFDIGSAGGIAGSGSDVGVIANAYYNGSSWIYKTSSLAARYQILVGTGSHAWYTAPSGTAGTAISFTQAMTLDASGWLGVGVTSVSCPLNVEKAAGSGNVIAKLYNTSSGGNGLLVDTTSPSTYIADFRSGAVSKARIDASGNLLVGKTTTDFGVAGINIESSGNVGATRSGAAPLNLNRLSTDGDIARFYKASVQVGSISVTASATVYNTLSDYRLKDNIQDITGSGAFIDALQPRSWNWKADGSVGAGFIAHELQAVSPSSVVGEKDAVDADGNPEYQAVEYGSAEVIAMLVAEVKSLRARLTAAGL